MDSRRLVYSNQRDWANNCGHFMVNNDFGAAAIVGPVTRPARDQGNKTFNYRVEGA